MIAVPAAIVAMALLSMAAQAQQIDVLGDIRAEIDGEEARFVTLRAGEEATASIERHQGVSYLSLMGTEREDGTGAQLVLSVMYMDTPTQPLPDTVLLDLFPTGFTPPFWTAPAGIGIEFTRFDADGATGRAEGSFTASLCRQDEPEDDVDLDDCREIRGSFATDLAIGQ